MRLGHLNVKRMPEGYQVWRKYMEGNIDKEIEETPLIVGDYFPSCQLIPLNRKQDSAYLGFPYSKKKISINEFTAEFVLIEFFSEFCDGCVKEIKNYIILYHKFNSDPRLSKRFKIIGVGAGSKKRNVMKFRKKHQIPFPLFADAKWQLFSCLGRPCLPTSYLVKQTGDNKQEIVLVQSGHIENINQFIKLIIKQMDMKP